MASKELPKNEENSIIAYVVDNETGEITKELHECDKIISYTENEYIDTHIINFKRDKGKTKKDNVFNKVYIESLLVLMKDLTSTELDTLIRISCYMSYDDCIIRYNDSTINIKQMSELTNLNYDTMRRIIPKLVKKNVLAKIKKNNKWCYAINPYIIFKGNDLLKEIENLFSNTKYSQIEVE